MLQAVPVTYRGVRFRSTLEADWAATLDWLGIIWQYEPEAVRLPSGDYYRCDFYLPEIATWLEVKGPHDERIGKAHELASAVSDDPTCAIPHTGDVLDCHCGEYRMVVIGRASIAGMADWQLLDWYGDTGALTRCTGCWKFWWVGEGAYGCRAHRRGQGGDDDLGGDRFIPARAPSGAYGDLLPFRRAPR